MTLQQLKYVITVAEVGTDHRGGTVGKIKTGQGSGRRNMAGCMMIGCQYIFCRKKHKIQYIF